jgi:hypothetical protein
MMQQKRGQKKQTRKEKRFQAEKKNLIEYQ